MPEYSVLHNSPDAWKNDFLAISNAALANIIRDTKKEYLELASNASLNSRAGCVPATVVFRVVNQLAKAHHMTIAITPNAGIETPD